MKKIILATFVAFVFMGCSSGDTHSTTTQVVNTAIIDASATMEAYIGIIEVCPICQMGGVYTAATMGMAAVIGADASGAFGGRQSLPNKNGKINNISLESYLLVPNNETEQFGISHNITLNFINAKQDKQAFMDKLLIYDSISWNEALSQAAPSLNQADKNEILQQAKNGQLIQHLESKHLFSFDASMNFDNYLMVSSLSNQSRNEVRQIVNTYRNFVESKTSSIDELTYLNNEINSRLKIEETYTIEEKATLIFLSVLKHSTFYWESSN